ncbi:hypothetical protein FA95DRAFT_1115777 [Auriscalpium vulgare]|uniref:Uncharacterized protein n=1 Tax=Auriscalpium vulgare TaxID=40419 RepID=A0ACB8RX07_9AGAM|nr:hypothetical protein FA95DRAFT_1115777 [Auriscalpium vulgare]
MVPAPPPPPSVKTSSANIGIVILLRFALAILCDVFLCSALVFGVHISIHHRFAHAAAKHPVGQHPSSVHLFQTPLRLELPRVFTIIRRPSFVKADHADSPVPRLRRPSWRS